jgi:hypothetical protein
MLFGATSTIAALFRLVTLRFVNVIDMAVTVPVRPDTETLEPESTLLIGFDPPNVCAVE